MAATAAPHRLSRRALAVAVDAVVLRVAATLAAGVALGLLAVGPARAQQPAGDDALMLVLDASGSMAADAGGGQTRIQAARAALTSLVDEFPDRVQVGLTVYGHRVGSDDSLKEQGCRDIETIIPVGPLDRGELTGAVTSFDPSGYTPIGASLRQAAEELSDVDGRLPGHPRQR